MMKKRTVLIVLLALALSAVTLSVLAQVDDEYELAWFTIDGGGATSTGGDFAVSGIIGQPDAGSPASGGAFNMAGGFQVMPSEANQAAHIYEVTWFTMDGGGAANIGGEFAVFGTVGQPDAGNPLAGGVFTVTGGFQVESPGSGVQVCGDVHPSGGGDGDVDVLDSLRSLKISIGSVLPTTAEAVAGDLHPDNDPDPDGDGDIDVLDALRNLKATVGLVNITSCGGPK